MKVVNFIGTAIWYGILIAFVVLVFAVVCSNCQTIQDKIVTYRFVAPGLSGMVSNYDDEMIQATDALYLLNADVTTKRGVMKRRTAIADYGVNVTSLYGAFGYYNPLTGDKLVIGVTDHATYGLGQFVVSDTFGTEVGYDTLGGTIFPCADCYHDFTPYKDMVICADGKSIPSIFTTSQYLSYRYTSPDTFGYKPRLISMGMEAPGQPRIALVKEDGQLDGYYQHAFAYAAAPMGLSSRAVRINSDLRAYITNIPYRDTLIIIRKKLYGEWLIIDTIANADSSYPIYVDSIADLSVDIQMWVRWYRNDSIFYDTFSSLDGVRDLVWYYGACQYRRWVIDRNCKALLYWPSCCGRYRASVWDGVTEYTHPNLANDMPGSSWPDDWRGNYDSITTDVTSFSVIGPEYFSGAWHYRVNYVRNDSSLSDTFTSCGAVPALYQSYRCSTTTQMFVCGVERDEYDSLAYRESFVKTGTTYTCSTGFPSHDRTYYSSVTTDVDSFFIDTVAGQLFVNPTSGERPGQLRVIGEGPSIVCDTLESDLFHVSSPESAYYIAYSYYDQVTGMESGLGPPLVCSLTVEDTTDNCISSRLLSWMPYDMISNPKTIRVYQGIVETQYPGGGDTMVWYGILEIKSTDSFITVGNWSDKDVTLGLDTSDITVQQYYGYQMLRNDLGDVKVLPPYSYSCQIPFSDIEYMAGQFWGIGDPDRPSWVYFSEYDWVNMNIFSWYPLDFIQINELGNDELIKIERAEGFGDDALYVFAHNSIWILNTSGDYQAISTRIGAVSQETVVKHGENVYFLSPNLRFYVLTGSQFDEKESWISQGIDNYVESVFVDWNIYGYQRFYAWGHTFGDYVRWFNDTTGMGLSYNTKSGAWSLERYGSGAYVPRGSISYDTMHASGVTTIMTSNLELLYTDSTVSLRKADPTAAYDVAGSGVTNCLERAIQFGFQSPRFGDGIRYQQIQRFDVTMNIIHGGAFHYTVYDGSNDSLCGDSVSLIYSDTTVHLRIHPPYNVSMRPSLKLYSNDTDTATIGVDPRWTEYFHNFNVTDITVKVRDMGVGGVQ